ncbi:hypothetical protein IT568_05075 [bacterium]|nr:hypothetical protein [bacterium]
MKRFIFLALTSILLIACGNDFIDFAQERAEVNAEYIKRNLDKPLNDPLALPEAVQETALLRTKMKIQERAEISKAHILQAENVHQLASIETDKELAGRLEAYAKKLEDEAQEILER